MKWNAVPGIACLLSFMLPVAVIVLNRYYTHRSLAALLIYYIFSALNIIMIMDLLSLSTNIRNNFILFSVYLAVPVVLTSLLFFCPNKAKQRIINYLIISFALYEIMITAVYGFNPVTAGYILGPGLLLIFCQSTFIFVRQVKFTIMQGKNHGRSLMLSSMLFAYACYILIYYFYFIQKTPDTADTVLLYYIASFITSIIMALGLHLMRRRMRELKSLKTTRKELALFFSN
jgi:hypothetical protein